MKISNVFLAPRENWIRKIEVKKIKPCFPREKFYATHRQTSFHEAKNFWFKRGGKICAHDRDSIRIFKQDAYKTNEISPTQTSFSRANSPRLRILSATCDRAWKPLPVKSYFFFLLLLPPPTWKSCLVLHTRRPPEWNKINRYM